MTRWSAITRTRGRHSALAYGSRSMTAAEDNLNRLVHHERGRYSAGTHLRERSYLVREGLSTTGPPSSSQGEEGSTYAASIAGAGESGIGARSGCSTRRCVLAAARTVERNQAGRVRLATTTAIAATASGRVMPVGRSAFAAYVVAIDQAKTGSEFRPRKLSQRNTRDCTSAQQIRMVTAWSKSANAAKSSRRSVQS